VNAIGSGGPASKPKVLAILVQIFALLFGCAAVLWGAFWVYQAAFPGPCGDSGGPGLGVIEAWLVNLPLGLAILAVGSFVKKGLPRLRRTCIFTALLALSLPVAASLVLLRWHCP
jgi:hypothetical protein